MLEQGSLELFNKNSANYIIKFDTTKESIDADTLADALISYKKTVLAMAANRHDSEEITVDVEVVEQGCIEIHTVLTAIQSVLNPETFPAIIDGVKNVVNLYKFLKGRPAKRVETGNSDSSNVVTITNAENSKIVVTNNVYNYYTNTDTPPFGDSRKYAKDKITAVRLIDKDKNEQVRIDYEDFGCFEKSSHKIENGDGTDEELVMELVVATIPIGKPRNQWSFFCNGESIQAKIKDESFLQKIARCEIEFAQGDRIVANVMVHKEFVSALNCFVVKHRTITRVIEQHKAVVSANRHG